MADEEQVAAPITELTHEPGVGGSEVSADDLLKSDEQREAEQDATLDKLLGGMDDVGEPGVSTVVPSEEEPGSEGTPPDVTEGFDPLTAVQDQDVAAPVIVTEVAADVAKETPPVIDDQRRLAEAILRQDGGWTAEDLALLPRDRVLAISEHRRGVQKNVDEHYTELVGLRVKSEMPPGERTGSEKEAEVLAPLDVSSLAEKLTLDEEGAQELVGLLQRQTAPLLAKIASLETGTSKAEGIALRVEAEMARRDLGERFPQLKDVEAYRRVLKTMTQLQRGGSKLPTAPLMEDAALITFADEIMAKASEADTKLRTARANGQLTTTTTERREPAASTKKLTQDEREDQVLDLLEGATAADKAEKLAAARKIGGSLW